MRQRILLSVGAATLLLLGSQIGVAQGADASGAAAGTSLTTDVAAADPTADEPSSASEATDDDPETAPTAEELALGAEATAEEPTAAPSSAEDGQRVGLAAGQETTCDDQMKSAAETPGGEYTACASLLEPADELSAGEQAALSRREASANTSAAEKAALAAMEATRQGVAGDAAPAAVSADESDAAAAAARRSPWNEPKWCTDAGVDSTWYIERMRGCGIWRAEVSAVDVRTGRRVGGIKYLVVGYSFSARDSKTWAYQTRLMEVSRWGQKVNGTKAYGSASCTGKCKVAEKSFPAQAINSSAEPYGQFFMDTTINTAASKQRGTGRSIATWRFTNPQWIAPSDATKLGTVDVRCDNALPGAPRQVGCVNPQAVPEISYSLTGPWPAIADHIRDAQASGLPGKHGTNKYLTRLTDGSKIKQNRNKACPSSLERPPGKSCDELKFPPRTGQRVSTLPGRGSA
ncbi:hypothetical protein [Streptomyces sp. NPDC000983]|uniref:hypothetical protein n=1 Tax=Streptomyces sp. NPDC000983 TaxID=3154373 RepID=UPI00331E9FBD